MQYYLPKVKNSWTNSGQSLKVAEKGQRKRRGLNKDKDIRLTKSTGEKAVHRTLMELTQ